MSSIAWLTTPPCSNASKFSFTAFTLPGRVTTSVLLIVPATGRASAANGVFCNELASKTWTIPGASRSKSGRTACAGGQRHTLMKIRKAHALQASYRAHQSPCPR